jgi:hypothetical protein
VVAHTCRWLQDSYGIVAAELFFLSLIIIGSLFALNLALAVISENYSAKVQRDVTRIEKAKATEIKQFNLMALRAERQRKYEEEEGQRRNEFETRAREAALQAQLADSEESVAANAAVAVAAKAVADAAYARDEAAIQGDIEAGVPLGPGVKPPKGSVVGVGGVMYRPKNPLRSWCFDLVCSPSFDALIMFCIFLNTLR